MLTYRTAPGTGIVGAVNVTFYGVRGSCPCSGDRYRRYGGNTSCLVIEIEGDEPLIVDLGTGLRALGDVLLKEVRAVGAPLHATALLTHLHFDHILGLPFFGPLQDPGARLTVHGPAQPKGSLKDALHTAVQPPVFPIRMDEFRGELITVDTLDEDFSIGSAKVMARSIPHCGNTLGYRIEADGRSLAYLPDHQAPLDRRQHFRCRPRAVPGRRPPVARRPVHRGRVLHQGGLGPLDRRLRRPRGGRGRAPRSSC